MVLTYLGIVPDNLWACYDRDLLGYDVSQAVFVQVAR